MMFRYSWIIGKIVGLVFIKMRPDLTMMQGGEYSYNKQIKDIAIHSLAGYWTPDQIFRWTAQLWRLNTLKPWRNDFAQHCIIVRREVQYYSGWEMPVWTQILWQSKQRQMFPVIENSNITQKIWKPLIFYPQQNSQLPAPAKHQGIPFNQRSASRLERLKNQWQNTKWIAFDI